MNRSTHSGLVLARRDSQMYPGRLWMAAFRRSLYPRAEGIGGTLWGGGNPQGTWIWSSKLTGWQLTVASNRLAMCAGGQGFRKCGGRGGGQRNSWGGGDINIR